MKKGLENVNLGARRLSRRMKNENENDQDIRKAEDGQ